MKKWLFTFIIVIGASRILSAQNLEEGIKALYYERYSSAQNILERIVQSNSKDAKAAYWLGQVYIHNPNISDGIAKAKTIYQKSLQDNFNSAYLLLGMGEIDLLTDNNIAAAKQKFEQAILSSKNDPDILNAIGRANAAGSKLVGDPGYAIELLKKATVADTKNPDIDYNLAVNMLKLDASFKQPAIDALNDATKRNPTYAKAFYEIGKILQKSNNPANAKEYFQKAIAADPNFGPTYLEATNLLIEEKDYKTAENYLKKYNQLTENSINTQNLLAFLLLKNSNTIEAQKTISNFIANNPNSRVIASKAYNIAAEAYYNNPDSAKYFYQKIFETDTSVYGKIESTDSLITIYHAEKDTLNEYVWNKNKFLTIPVSKEEYKYQQVLPRLCAAILKAGSIVKSPKEFAFSDSVFQLYINQNPDKEYGYFGRVKNAISADSTNEKAIIPIQNYIKFLNNDKVKNKVKLVYYHDILGVFFANVKKDYKLAISEYQSILDVDPNNARAKDILEKLKQQTK